ncbi:unnamed protein product [Fraxinus pennsylvanica]|uniref:ARM repeat superfamily protein n=1 Tax=Fraxinus pennsylvanica TaxID=56036 RepID=A0AAD1Z7X4_9LAMI|nr:unnamed protein product [Fraxinus pennsylvanica]
MMLTLPASKIYWSLQQPVDEQSSPSPAASSHGTPPEPLIDGTPSPTTTRGRPTWGLKQIFCRTIFVRNSSRRTLQSVANSGAAVGLPSLLERLFSVDDIRVGATSRKAIPVLVDLLKPIPDRPGAPFLSLGLLIQVAKDCPNQIVMVESGALEGLTKYFSPGPQDATEEATTDLQGILVSTAEIRRQESAFGAVSQLVAVLHLGGRTARYSAAKALENLFSADYIRNTKSARQAVQPLVEILNTGLKKEHHAAIGALVRLLSENPSRALAVQDVEMNAAEVLCRILSSNYLEVPVAVLVRLLRSGLESTLTGTLNALLVLETDDSTSAEAMAKSVAIEVLLEILRYHQCEETAEIEVLFYFLPQFPRT